MVFNLSFCQYKYLIIWMFLLKIPIKIPKSILYCNTIKFLSRKFVPNYNHLAVYRHFFQQNLVSFDCCPESEMLRFHNCHDLCRAGYLMPKIFRNFFSLACFMGTYISSLGTFASGFCPLSHGGISKSDLLIQFT